MTIGANRVKESFGPSKKEIEIGEVVELFTDEPLELKSGQKINKIPIAFQTYGKPNEDFSNAILICHALTGDQYLIGPHPVTGKPGWWENYVGSGKPIDTDKNYIICPNVLGGCMGSFGPRSINPEDDKPYNLSFPVITISDMVNVQKELVKQLGVEKLKCVIGGSMGGMQALEWLSKHSEDTESVIAIATSAKHSPQNIAFNEIGRQSIMADEGWCNGNYLAENNYPTRGLSIARMMAHITYLSESGLDRKFGRRLQDKENISYGFDIDFQVESYLRHQGMSFVERFDPNSYLYISRAMDYFDLAEENDGNLSKAFKDSNAAALIVSFSSDWLFTADDAKAVTRALSASSCDVSFVNIEGDNGHDSFLLPDPILEKTIKGFLD
jgi:homoserine O-acetyltransferase